MTPMPANPDAKANDPAQPTPAFSRTRLKLVRDSSPAESSGEHSVFRTPSISIAGAPATARLMGSPVEGTIGAAVAPLDRESYSTESETLLTGVPLVRARHLQPATAPLVRAKDLIGELREISGQVNRMMSQVDRAIHRLGEHAGEPLRR